MDPLFFDGKGKGWFIRNMIKLAATLLDQKSMKKGIIFLFASILLLACHTDQKKNQDTDNIVSLDSVKPNREILDSLSNPNSYYYLSNIPIEESSRLILIDSINPSDNKITFDAMDSLSSSNQKTRDYFFKVFIKILDKADGALSEVIGSYTINYIEKYPKEFIERTSKIDVKYFECFASFTGYELGFSNDQGSNWLDSLNYRCSNCDFSQLKKFGNFRKIVQEHIDENNGK